tara:strand:- start:815 stop:979 length:165 start_codon:yes stop_codon:yes gene_type:complete
VGLDRTDKMVEANGVVKRTDSFGDKEGVPLLVMGGQRLAFTGLNGLSINSKTRA